MIYAHCGSIEVEVLSTKIESAVLVLTPGSNIARLRFRCASTSSWLSYEQMIFLPYSFSGNSEKKISG